MKKSPPENLKTQHLTITHNAVRMVRDAVKDYGLGRNYEIEIFGQGSYQNNTNVRNDSDVDVCVMCKNWHFIDTSVAVDQHKLQLTIQDISAEWWEFKNEVGNALSHKFNQSDVHRGNKAFDIRSNSYRIDADVIACFQHRKITVFKPSGAYDYFPGTGFIADDGAYVENWPNQHYQNGIAKNKRTGNRFKFLTRALKRIRNEMTELGVVGPAYPVFLNRMFSVERARYLLWK